MTMAKFTKKRAAFCLEYIVDFNGAAAARRAGYSAKTANRAATVLLSNADIQAQIRRLMAARTERVEVTADRVVDELAAIGFANVLDYIRVDGEGSVAVDLSATTRAQAAAIKDVSSETLMQGQGDDARPILKSNLKLTDKIPALTLLGKHVGLFPISAKFEHVGANGGPIAIENESANKDQDFDALFTAMTKPEQYRVLDALAVVLEVNEMVRARIVSAKQAEADKK